MTRIADVAVLHRYVCTTLHLRWRHDSLRSLPIRTEAAHIDRFVVLVSVGGICLRFHRHGWAGTVAERAVQLSWWAGGGSCAPAGPDDSFLVCEDDDLHAVAQAGLGEDAGDVAFHGCCAEVEAGRDLGIRLPLCH